MLDDFLFFKKHFFYLKFQYKPTKLKVGKSEASLESRHHWSV